MAGLKWVRLESNIASHDKILALVAERDGVKAAWMYVCSLAHCAGHGTDGLVSFNALPFIHGTRRLAELCVTHGLWIPDPKGWRVKNYLERQQPQAASELARSLQSEGGRRGNCKRWHPPGCECWKTDGWPESGIRSVR